MLLNRHDVKTFGAFDYFEIAGVHKWPGKTDKFVLTLQGSEVEAFFLNIGSWAILVRGQVTVFVCVNRNALGFTDSPNSRISYFDNFDN